MSHNIRQNGPGYNIGQVEKSPKTGLKSDDAFLNLKKSNFTVGFQKDNHNENFMNSSTKKDPNDNSAWKNPNLIPSKVLPMRPVKHTTTYKETIVGYVPKYDVN